MSPTWVFKFMYLGLILVSVGNHEYDEVSTAHPTWHPSWGNYGDDSGGECGVPVKKR